MRAHRRAPEPLCGYPAASHVRQPETSKRGTEPWATPPPRLGSYLLKREIARDPLEVTFLARDASQGERSVLVRLLCRHLDDETKERLKELE